MLVIAKFMERKIRMVTLIKCRISEMIEHPDNQTLLPPLTKEDEDELEASLRREIKPIPFEVLANHSKYLILDGNNRFRILNKIGYDGELPCIVLGNVGDWPIQMQRTTIQKINLARRHITNEQKKEIARQMVARGEDVRVVAKVVGIGKSTVARATQDIMEARDEAIYEVIGDLSKAGLSQREIAETIGLAQKTVSNINNSKDERCETVSNLSQMGQITHNIKAPKDENDEYEDYEDEYIEEDVSEEEIFKDEYAIDEEQECIRIIEKAKCEAKAKIDEMAILARAKLPKEQKEKEPIKETESTFNFTNENIDWARWSWNPVTGCNHGCTYCYARDIAMRFTGHFNPEFHEKRLSAPKNTRIPKGRENEPGMKKVFVGSMSDLFGEWFDMATIQRILDTCAETPQWTYLFLTKNPKRYIPIEFPSNAWVGATADTQKRCNVALDSFSKMMKHRPSVLFLSCEPLLEKIVLPENKIVDWIIIGSQSRTARESEFQPNWRWVVNLLMQSIQNNIFVYCKPNLDCRLPKDWPV